MAIKSLINIVKCLKSIHEYMQSKRDTKSI
jgi:hypothetical protein